MTPGRTPIRIGTRGSDLALAQTRTVITALRAGFPGLPCQEVVLSTRGDRLAEAPFSAVGSRGIFARDIEDALLGGHVDLAVHSLKDLESDLPEGLIIGAILPRADARDALAAAGGYTLATLPPGARLATSSIRRTALLHRARPDLRIEPIRGNVPTRLRKAHALGLDGVVLACAGLDRLGRAASISERLAVETMLPEAGQGAIAVEVRRADAELQELLTVLHDATTTTCCAAERACVRRLEGNCRTPIAAYAVREAEQLWLRALVCSPDGGRIVQADQRGPHDASERIGLAVADELLRAGAAALLG